MNEETPARRRMRRTEAVSTFVYLGFFLVLAGWSAREWFDPLLAAFAILCATQTITSFARWRGSRLSKVATVALTAVVAVCGLAGITVAVVGHAFHADHRRVATLLAILNGLLAGVWVAMIVWATRRVRRDSSGGSSDPTS